MTTSLLTAAAVRADNARKVYGSGETAVTALDDVTLSLPSGRFTAIMGSSGSGKSTLMHCMAGLDNLTSGQVFIGDLELGRLSDRQLTQLRRDRVGFVFQAFNLLATLSALENITLPMTLAGVAPDRDWLEMVIGTVGLAGRLSHRPAELSGG
jgi:putative ABC transport system ATP-binding protein